MQFVLHEAGDSRHGTYGDFRFYAPQQQKIVDDMHTR